MFQTFRNAWKIHELKNRLLFTLAILVVYRLGCAIPVPFVSGSALTQMFANGDALFMPHSMAMLNSQQIKESEVDIGVIPMPKADEIQEDYSSSSNVYHLQMVAVPITNTANLEATLYALEAMAWYGQQYVTPQYYEKVLKLQKFRDEDAEEMLDLIFKNRTYDMAIAYNFSDMIQFYNKLLGGRTTDIVSKFDASRAAYQEAIDNAIATFTQQ